MYQVSEISTIGAWIPGPTVETIEAGEAYLIEIAGKSGRMIAFEIDEPNNAADAMVLIYGYLTQYVIEPVKGAA